MPTARHELVRLVRLAGPIAGTQLGNMLMGIVDTLFVARVGVDALAAASLGNAFLYGTLLVGQGLVLGIDPFVTQAHGAGDGRSVGLALQRGLVVSVLVTVAISAILLFTSPVLVFLGQEPVLAQEAGRYIDVQIPTIGAFFGFLTLRSYLQGMGLVRPALLVMLAANAANVLFNWIFVFGHLGAPALGLVGTGLATALSRLLLLLGLAGVVWGTGIHRAAWTPWSRAAFDAAALRRIVGVGLPTALQMGLEVGAFSAATLLAGRLGARAVAAHTVALSLASLSFMVPLGVAQAACTRVGNLLGARRFADADRSARVAVGLGAAVMAVSALLFVTLRGSLPQLYTADAMVVALAATILPIAAAFQVFDGVQVVAAGVLRGMGNTRPAALLNFAGYWIVSLPLAAWLTLRAGGGLESIWWSLCLGLFLVAAGLVAFLRARGPATAAPGHRVRPRDGQVVSAHGAAIVHDPEAPRQRDDEARQHREQ